MNKERYLYLFLLSVLLFIIGFLYQNEGNFLSENHQHNSLNFSGGDYLRYVFIGSYTCPFSNSDRTHDVVNDLKETLSKAAQESFVNFIATGISVDTDPNLALRYLSNTFPYNELLIGNSVYNLGSIVYGSGAPSTPTVLIFHENHNTDLTGINFDRFDQSQQLLHSAVGVFEIEALYSALESSTPDEILNFFNL